MAFKPATWYPIAVALSVINLVGAGLAVGQAEPSHAAIHAALALVFGLLARRLRPGPGGRDLEAGHEELEALEGEVRKLRQELAETQERLDFAERLLTQGPEKRRVEQPRQDPQ
jgi:hypothetical protein